MPELNAYLLLTYRLMTQQCGIFIWCWIVALE